MKQELTLDQIHKQTIGLIKKYISICERIKVDYCVYYGSLIGAVRHHGFIPWDDDFDVIMLRPDFNRFISYCIKNKASLYPYELKCRQTDKDYPYNIPRFCDTRFIMEKENIDTNMGLFIDIYPFDGVGNNCKAAKRKISLRKNLYNSCITYINKEAKPTSKVFYKNILRKIVFLYSKMHTREYFFNKLNCLKELYPYDNSEYVECIVWSSFFNPVKKAWLKPFETIDFENIEVKIPNNYHAILSDRYGDYMQLPPEKERKPHHDYKLYKIR